MILHSPLLGIFFSASNLCGSYSKLKFHRKLQRASLTKRLTSSLSRTTGNAHFLILRALKLTTLDGIAIAELVGEITDLNMLRYFTVPVANNTPSRNLQHSRRAVGTTLEQTMWAGNRFRNQKQKFCRKNGIRTRNVLYRHKITKWDNGRETSNGTACHPLNHTIHKQRSMWQFFLPIVEIKKGNTIWETENLHWKTAQKWKTCHFCRAPQMPRITGKMKQFRKKRPMCQGLQRWVDWKKRKDSTEKKTRMTSSDHFSY